MQQDQYVALSLELHLFFARIMKEHALFLKAGFTPVDPTFARDAEFYKREFEKVLAHAVALGDGVVGQSVLSSGEIVTEFTAEAENETQRFTGIVINKTITAQESRMRSGRPSAANRELRNAAAMLNQTAVRLLNGLIEFKERVLDGVLRCRTFTVNYPLLIEHILREAKMYRCLTLRLESGAIDDPQSMRETENFWNRIMMEHAMFIRGLLDPTENALIETANGFADNYEALLARAQESDGQALLRSAALRETVKFQEFKTAGTQGISNCKIRSVILPLLADHVLREANHYIRLLNE